ncbi:hypothetical protein FGG08_000053 [Glutinoglossum americanum]|uniref:Uncharacterized protein n=1 Tax=Glutinoglossum americanum TaxID=1670608 RepID=A0A9P8IH03_9PEZI|nr:hypothetical protein FGG08_000053 [Glutinoglossum americanum]
MEPSDRREDENELYQESIEVTGVDGGFTTSPEQEKQETNHPERGELKAPRESKELREKTEERTKRLLHVEDSDSSIGGDGVDLDGDAKALENANAGPAFSSTEARSKANGGDEYVGVGGKTRNTESKLQSLTSSITHPKNFIKSTAQRTTAKQLSKIQDPFAPRRSDLQVVETYDELQRTKSQIGIPVESRDEAAKSQEETLKALEKRRESTLATWITGRHVQRVRVAPRGRFMPPRFEDFVDRDEEGEEVRVRWEQWLGRWLLYYTQDFSTQYVDEFVDLPFDVNTLRLYAERVIVASAPWQTWLMHIRSVYRWEDPAETGRWFALFVFLWYNSKIMTFVSHYENLSTVLWTVRCVASQSHPSSGRSQNSNIGIGGATAYKIGELIGKHGREGWLQPMIDHMGPLIQAQIGDLANILEVMYNFYHWKAPQKTVASLYFFFTCFLISATADMEFCMKIIWFIIGGTFFICGPYGIYRLTVRHSKFSGYFIIKLTPSLAEWTFQYLRRESQSSRETPIQEKIERIHHDEETPMKRQNGSPVHHHHHHHRHSPPEPLSTDENEAEDWQSADSAAHNTLNDQTILSCKCECSGTSGRLAISSSSIHFARSRPPKDELWRRSFSDLVAMSKTSQPAAIGIHRHHHHHHHNDHKRALDLEFADGEVVRLGGFRERDRAFNCIVGVSGLRWAVANDRK